MSDQRLIDTIKHKLSLGVTEPEIVETLTVLGWTEFEIKTSINNLLIGQKQSTETKNKPPLEEPKPKIIQPSTPQIIFADNGIAVPRKNSKKQGNQTLIISIIIVISLIGGAVFIFLGKIQEINVGNFSINSIIASIFPSQKPTSTPEPSIPPSVNPTTPPSAPTGDMTIYGPFDLAGELTMSQNNFTFFYEKDGYQYININGASYGPYKRFSNKGIPRIIVPSIYGEKFGFSYYDATKESWYVNINGNVRGPYIDSSNVYYSKSGYIFAAKEKESIYYYIYVNDKKYGPYVSIEPNVYISETGSYAFTYASNGKKNINLNGKIYGPYNTTENGVMYRDENFYFIYNENGKEFVNIKGEVYESNGSKIYDYPKNGFELHYTKKDNKQYININGKEIIDEEKTALEKNYFFKKGNEYFINIGIKNEGPYKKTTFVSKNKNSYIFGYQLSDGQWFVNINGVGKGPYQDVLPELFISEDNHYGFIFQKEGKWNVEIK